MVRPVRCLYHEEVNGEKVEKNCFVVCSPDVVEGVNNSMPLTAGVGQQMKVNS